MLKEGDKAIDFSLKDKDGKFHSLKSTKADYVVLYFYPKDDTPGCTIEANSFNKSLPEFKKLKVEIVGISGGDEKTKEKFCKRYGLTITLVSDSDFTVSKKYGVYGEKSFMGRKYMGISRTTFVISNKVAQPKIVKIFENVKPLGHSKEVFDFIKSIR